jgi:hypothetical protein
MKKKILFAVYHLCFYPLKFVAFLGGAAQRTLYSLALQYVSAANKPIQPTPQRGRDDGEPGGRG